MTTELLNWDQSLKSIHRLFLLYTQYNLEIILGLGYNLYISLCMSRDATDYCPDKCVTDINIP